MHHLFVDHQFTAWQRANRAREATIAESCTEVNAPCKNSVALSTVLEMNGLAADVSVGDVLDTQKGDLCYTYDYF